MESSMNREDPSNTQSLPHHLLSEHILPRLAVEPLVRFKSVSKSWLSTVSSPELTKSHLKLFSTHHPKFILLSNSNNNNNNMTFYSLSCEENTNTNKHLVRLESLSVTQGWKKCYLVGTCRGLVCLYLDNNMTTNNNPFESMFVIWNPATRQYRKVDVPDKGLRASSYAFGFAAGDLMIVAWFDAGVRAKDEDDKLHAFSSRMGTWRQVDGIKGTKLEGFDHVHVLSMLDPALVGDDAVYLQVGDPVMMHVEGVVGLDLVRGEARAVALPDGGYDWGSLFVLSESLMIFGSKVHGIDLYAFKRKKSGDVYAWEQFLFVPNAATLGYVLSYSVNGKCLVCRDGQLKLIDPSRDDDGGDARGVDFDGVVADGKNYFESLVSPFANNI